MKAAITNLSAYNGGSLRFEWLELPATEDELADVLDKIGNPEEWFVTDYDVDNVDAYEILGEYPSLDEMNAVAEVDELDDYDDLKNYALENDIMTSVVDEIISADELDELVKIEAEKGAARLFFFLAQLDGLSLREDDHFKINAYENVEALGYDDYRAYAGEVAQAAAMAA